MNLSLKRSVKLKQILPSSNWMDYPLAKSLALIPISFALGTQIWAQTNRVMGEVKDDEGEDIKFVHIFVNEDFTHSYFTDVDGKFEIKTDTVVKKLTFLHFDHDPVEMEFDESVPDSLHVTLNSIEDFNPPKQRKGNFENPAWAVIQKVVANERLHDPEKQGGAFRYTSYSKTVVDLFETQHHKIKEKFRDKIIEDSLFVKHHRTHGHQHLEVVETVAKRTFEYPDKNHERIEGLKLTGLDDQEISPLHSNHHPLSFYGDYFDFLGTRYASPIGAHTHKKYNFYKKGTLYVGQDTIHVIFYRPRHLRNVKGLEGNLYINSKQYAVQAIVARPFEKGLIDFEVAQLYQFVDNKEWFPVQMNYVYLLHKFPKRYMGTIYDKKTYIKDIELNPDFGPKDHGVELVVCDHYTKEQTEDFWNHHRIEPLSKKEQRTYLRVDTLRHQSTPAIIAKRLAAFYNSKLSYRLPFFEIGNVFALNRFEGVRLGLSLKTSEDLFQTFELNTYGAYGFRDEIWKRGVGFGLTLNKKKAAKVNFMHSRDLEEPGEISYLEKKQDFFRKIFTDRMDDLEANKLTFRFRSLNYHLFEIGLNEYTKRPLYDYQYVSGMDQNGEILNNEFDITEATFRARYAIRERVSNILGDVVRLDTYYPIFYLNYTRGIEILGGDYKFNKVSVNMDYKFHVGHIGTSDLVVEAGAMDSDVPYPTLFNGNGGNLGSSSIIIKDAFQTMDIYEFTSNRFLNIFYSHNFGPLFFRHKFKPDFVIYQHVGWGGLNNPQLHRSTIPGITDSYKDGFYESGLGINNLIKFKLFGVVYGGLGAAFFYRYGPHKNPGGFGDNFVWRLTYKFQKL